MDASRSEFLFHLTTIPSLVTLCHVQSYVSARWPSRIPMRFSQYASVLAISCGVARFPPAHVYFLFGTFMANYADSLVLSTSYMYHPYLASFVVPSPSYSTTSSHLLVKSDVLGVQLDGSMLLIVLTPLTWVGPSDISSF